MPRGRPRLEITDEERLQRNQESKRRYEERNFSFRRLSKNLHSQTEVSKAQRRARYAKQHSVKTIETDLQNNATTDPQTP